MRTGLGLDDPLTAARYPRRVDALRWPTLTAQLRGRRITGLRYDPGAAILWSNLRAGATSCG